MTQEVSFKIVLEALLDDERPFPAIYLHRFSDLSPANLKALLKVWPEVSARRKYTLLEDLEDLAEADTLVCFDEVGRALLSDPDAPVRRQAILLLWECDDPRLVPAYLEIMENDPDLDTRAAAATALGRFIYHGELDELPADTKNEIESRLLDIYRSKEPVLLRRRVLESLGYSSREDVPPLIEAAYSERHPDWVASALFAMGRSSDDERWQKQVVSKLLAPDEDIRREAIIAAGELELKPARNVLLDLLEDEEDLELRRHIIWALSKIGGEGVRARLEELAEAEEDEEEADFLDEALANLEFTEEMGLFNLLDVEPDDDLYEEEPE